MSTVPRQSRRRSRKLAGAVLLEAIVAMAILASSGLALFAWAQQSLETVSRLQQVDASTRVKVNALAAVETVNPHVQPQGEIETHGLRVSWEAEELREAIPAFESGTAMGASQAGWHVGLYRLRVVAQPMARQEDVQRFEFVRAGWGPPGRIMAATAGSR